MDAIALHLEVRNALSLSDELGRHQHALGNDSLAGHLAAVRSLLSEIERDIGRSHEARVVASPATIERLEHCIAKLRDRDGEVPAPLKPRVGQLLAALDRVVFAESRPGEQVPAKPLFDTLPLARVVPQDVHSILDYVAAAGYAASAIVARTTRARVVGTLLGAQVAVVSAATDYKLSATRVVPVELHECFDYVSGVSAVAAPFVLGYLRKDPLAALLQIGAGLTTIVASLFTDYRADKGVGRALRSRGGPARYRKARRHMQKEPAREAAPIAPVVVLKNLPRATSATLEPRRVAEVQRPLEGLSGPSAIPGLEDYEVWEEPISR